MTFIRDEHDVGHKTAAVSAHQYIRHHSNDYILCVHSDRKKKVYKVTGDPSI